MYLLIDNFDSFTYNLYQYLLMTGNISVEVRRNNKLDDFNFSRPDLEGIIISPGPGHPKQIPNVISIIKNNYDKTPILGICLGHQAIGYAFGAEIVNATEIIHGKKTLLTHNNDPIFNNIDKNFYGGRYHSLIIKNNSLPNDFSVISYDNKNNEIMAIKHNNFQLYGLQFHPESVLTESGLQILKNFINLTKKEVANV